MFCINCGKAIKDGAKFCVYCGAKQETVENKEEANVTVAEKPVKEKKVKEKKVKEPKAPKEPKEKSSKKLPLIIALAALVLIIGGAAVWFFCIRLKPVDMGKYVKVEFSGYDEYGHATAEFNEKKFVRENEKKFKVTKSLLKLVEEEELGDFDLRDAKKAGFNLKEPDSDTAVKFFCKLFLENGSLDLADNLSNGDFVNYDFNLFKEFDEEEFCKIAKCFGVSVKTEPIPFEATKLKEVPSFDAFEGLEITFSGASPSLQPLIPDSFNQEFSYSLDNSRVYKNGDSLEVSIDFSNGSLESFIELYGKKPEALTKTIAISGYPEYVKDSSQLSSETINKMDIYAINAIAGSLSSNEDYLGAKLLGYYVDVSKDSGIDQYASCVTLVYRVMANGFDWFGDNPAQHFFYSYVNFYNVIDGEDFDANNHITGFPENYAYKYNHEEMDVWTNHTYLGCGSLMAVKNNHIPYGKLGSDYSTEYVELSKDEFSIVSSTDKIGNDFIIDSANYIAGLYSAYFKDYFNGVVDLVECGYSGYAFLYNEVSDENALTMLFKVKANNPYSEGEFSFYMAVTWEDLLWNGESLIYEKPNFRVCDSFNKRVGTKWGYSVEDSFLGYETYSDFYSSITEDYLNYGYSIIDNTEE